MNILGRENKKDLQPFMFFGFVVCSNYCCVIYDGLQSAPMPINKHRVRRSPDERKTLLDTVSKGSVPAKMIMHKFLISHRAYLDEKIQQKKFICAGRQNRQ